MLLVLIVYLFYNRYDTWLAIKCACSTTFPEMTISHLQLSFYLFSSFWAISLWVSPSTDEPRNMLNYLSISYVSADFYSILQILLFKKYFIKRVFQRVLTTSGYQHISSELKLLYFASCTVVQCTVETHKLRETIFKYLDR